MRKIFKVSVVFILVLSMVIGMGLNAYTTDTDEAFNSIGEGTDVVQDEPTDKSENIPAEPEDQADPQEGSEIGEPTNPEEPLEPESPVEPVDPESPEEPENPENPVDPENPGEPVNPEGPENPAVDPNIPPIVTVPPTTPTANPSIHIEVSTDKNSYLAGEIINYIIKVTNTGNVTLENVMIEDGFLGQKSIGILEIEEEQTFNEEYLIQLDNDEEILSNFINVVGYYGEIEVMSGSSFTINVETPQIGTLNYTVKYFIDGEEQIEWEINNQVSVDNPIVEEVPHENMPEGYIIDEEFSTVLPFMVTETENIIEVYYIQGLTLMSIVPGGLAYPASSDVFRLKMNSTNDNTEAIFAWMNGSDIYIAIVSFRPVTQVTYNGTTVPVNSSTVERAPETPQGRNYKLIVDGNDLGQLDLYARKPHNSHRWSVIKISGQNLTSQFTITAKTELGGGHDLIGVTVNIANSVLVYHSYDGSPRILDTDQSGGLTGSPLGYAVQPKYDYGGETYELEKIEVIHNGVSQGYFYPVDLDSEGYLRHTVPIVNFNANAEIIFYYVKAADGELTITKDVNGIGYSPNQEFDIFIYGPNGKKYVVTLADEESITLTGLEYGNYSVKEVVPMNYKLVGMTNGGAVTISKTNKHQSVTVTNEYTNDGWFFDDDSKINSFTVGGGISQKSMPVESRLSYSELEYFLVPVELEIDFKFDNA